jgi:hypothetical protein
MDGEALRVVNAYEEFTHSLSERHGAGEHDEGGARRSLVEVPRWFLDKSGVTSPEDSEGRGADWGGAGPLSIHSLRIIDAVGKECAVLPAHASFGIEVTIRTDKSGEFPCSCLLVVYDEAGHVVARFVEPERDYIAKIGEMMTVIAWIEDSPIGCGNYIVSGGLYAGYNRRLQSRGHRYHILSRGVRFRIASEVADDSRVLLTPIWKKVPGPEPAPEA